MKISIEFEKEELNILLSELNYLSTKYFNIAAENKKNNNTNLTRLFAQKANRLKQLENKISQKIESK